jgi:hypothetical protein
MEMVLGSPVVSVASLCYSVFRDWDRVEIVVAEIERNAFEGYERVAMDMAWRVV